MSFGKLLKGVQTVAVVCNQWGDTGKGKITDYLASGWADVTARGTGGNNAGHTVNINGNERIFHFLPSGITYDAEGKISIMGNGMVIDPPELSKELDELDRDGMTYDNLMISKDAHIIMPYHVTRDRRKNHSQKKGGIGSTGRGIGPCYASKIARTGITISDLYDIDVFSNKIRKNLRNQGKRWFIKRETDKIIHSLEPHIERIKPFVRDTVTEMHNYMAEGKKILLEGAQGLLLSIEHGTYPYVTSSDCSLNGTANGVGLSAKKIDLPLGMFKYPFMTRVGGGAFPTELGGERSEIHCKKPGYKIREELTEFGIGFEAREGKTIYDRKDPKIISMINSEDSFVQGVGIRLAAGEYGATTGRPRRTGWTDAVAARYAVGINGPLMVLSKPDSVSGAGEFRIAFGYDQNGMKITDFSKNDSFLRSVEPVYRSYEGYGDISSVRSYGSLPKSLRESVSDFERFTGGSVSIVSVGAERDRIIFR